MLAMPNTTAWKHGSMEALPLLLFLLFYIAVFLVKATNGTALEGTVWQPNPTILWQ